MIRTHTLLIHEISQFCKKQKVDFKYVTDVNEVEGYISSIEDIGIVITLLSANFGREDTYQNQFTYGITFVTKSGGRVLEFIESEQELLIMAERLLDYLGHVKDADVELGNLDTNTVFTGSSTALISLDGNLEYYTVKKSMPEDKLFVQ